MKSPMLIGIAGGTGSGKSTFAQRLLTLFPNDITVISYDNYYKPQDHLSFEERIRTNYDCPDALDTDLLVKHLRSLRNGESVDVPNYDFTIHTRKAELTLHIKQLEGENSHHIIEGAFKSVARSLAAACSVDEKYADEIPSTKGVL